MKDNKAELFNRVGIRVGICTNATLIDDFQIELLAKIGDVHVNVSLDGFSPESHDKFRGTNGVFNTAIKTITQLNKFGLLAERRLEMLTARCVYLQKTPKF